MGPLHAAPSPSSAPSSELLRPAVCRRRPRDPSRRPPATAGIAVFQVPSDFRVPLGCLRWTGWLVSQLAGFGADLPAHVLFPARWTGSSLGPSRFQPQIPCSLLRGVADPISALLQLTCYSEESPAPWRRRELVLRTDSYLNPNPGSVHALSAESPSASFHKLPKRSARSTHLLLSFCPNHLLQLCKPGLLEVGATSLTSGLIPVPEVPE